MNTTPTAQSSRRTGTGQLIRFLLLFSLAGAALACLLAWINLIGFFTPWDKVASTELPPGTVALVSGTLSTIYVQTADQKIWSCDIYYPEQCWKPDVVQEDYTHKSQACGQQSSAFLGGLKGPQDLAFCVDVVLYYPEATYHLAYGLDNQSNIWKWSNKKIGTDIFLYALALFAGSLGGLLVGSLVWVARYIIQRRSDSSGGWPISKPQIVLLALLVM